MARPISARVLLWTTAAVLTIVLAGSERSVVGKEKGVAESKAPKVEGEATEALKVEADDLRIPKGAVATKPFRGRLPAYYGRVVDQQQRQTIYSIQGEYAPRLAVLKARLEALKEERDLRVAAVLMPEQRERVKQFKAAALAARRQKRAAQQGLNTKPSDAGPAP